MNIDDMTLADLNRLNKERIKIAAMFSENQAKIATMFSENPTPTQPVSGLVGKYVIVRCKDAGVHAGVLLAHHNREATLKNSRRLWYWRSADRPFLSGVAMDGLSRDSKVGCEIDIHLTETCEIIVCSEKAATSIKELPDYAG